MPGVGDSLGYDGGTDLGDSADSEDAVVRELSDDDYGNFDDDYGDFDDDYGLHDMDDDYDEDDEDDLAIDVGHLIMDEPSDDDGEASTVATSCETWIEEMLSPTFMLNEENEELFLAHITGPQGCFDNVVP